MNINEILDFAFPVTPEHKKCKIELQKVMYRREKLRLMVERYKNGEIVNFEALHISVDMEEIMKRINN